VGKSKTIPGRTFVRVSGRTVYSPFDIWLHRHTVGKPRKEDGSSPQKGQPQSKANCTPTGPSNFTCQPKAGESGDDRRGARRVGPQYLQAEPCAAAGREGRINGPAWNSHECSARYCFTFSHQKGSTTFERFLKTFFTNQFFTNQYLKYLNNFLNLLLTKCSVVCVQTSTLLCVMLLLNFKVTLPRKYQLYFFYKLFPFFFGDIVSDFNFLRSGFFRMLFIEFTNNMNSI